jgi:hypothetical protein
MYTDTTTTATPDGGATRHPCLSDLGTILHTPFPVERIHFLPKERPVEDGKAGGYKIKVLPHVEVWDYKRLLNLHAFGSWSICDAETLPLKDRLIVLLKLRIAGVTMWGVGEELLKGTTGILDENASTSAWAQAFKRACAYFGLGGYLYFLGKPGYVAYDMKGERIAASASDLLALAKRLYEAASRRGDLQQSPGSVAGDLVALAPYLKEPFPPELVDFLPHSVRRGTLTTCTAVPYVKVWHYVRWLNARCYGLWQIAERPEIAWTDKKVIVTLKLSLFGGEPMVGIGEAFWIKEREGKAVPQENAVENAWAQAFKRSLQALGLGLDLRFLPSIDDAVMEYGSVANTRALATDLYRSAGLLKGGSSSGTGEGVRRMPGTPPIGEPAVGGAVLIGEGQKGTIRMLCGKLGQTVPENLAALSASAALELIARLSGAFNERQKAAHPAGGGTDTRKAVASQLARLREQGREPELIERYQVGSLEELTFAQAAQELASGGKAR